LHLAVPARLTSLGVVRTAMARLDGVSDAMLGDALLLTTELVTNSVRHAGLAPDDVIEVDVVRSGPVLRVRVRDGGTWVPPARGVIGAIRPSPGAQSGWGLYLVERLAARWGTNGGGGFWFELEEPPSGAPTA
jgi:anti-sigma regulatory factor (Ser/Thr protein kinase)